MSKIEGVIDHDVSDEINAYVESDNVEIIIEPEYGYLLVPVKGDCGKSTYVRFVISTVEPTRVGAMSTSSVNLEDFNRAREIFDDIEEELLDMVEAHTNSFSTSDNLTIEDYLP